MTHGYASHDNDSGIVPSFGGAAYSSQCAREKVRKPCTSETALLIASLCRDASIY